MNVLYQDDFYIAVYKPSNLFVHPSKEAPHIKENLLKDVKCHLNEYVYPVHRLDRPVSGIVLFARSSESVKSIKEIWNTQSVRKFYLGLTRGIFLRPGRYDFELGDKNKVKKSAITCYEPLERFKSSTLVEIEILTGRYHQIRRHFAREVDHLLGDRKYGKKKYNDNYMNNFNLNRIFLHSHRFEFVHPYTGKEVVITCPLPEDLQNTLELLKKEHLETIRSSEYITSYYG